MNRVRLVFFSVMAALLLFYSFSIPVGAFSLVECRQDLNVDGNTFVYYIQPYVVPGIYAASGSGSYSTNVYNITSGSGAPAAFNLNGEKSGFFRQFNLPLQIPAPTKMILSSMYDYLLATDYLAVNLVFETYDSDLSLNYLSSQLTEGVKWVTVGNLGDLKRCKLVFDTSNRSVLDTVLSKLYSGNYIMQIPIYTSASNKTGYFSTFYITNSPNSVPSPGGDDSSDNQLIVNGIENLEAAVIDAIQSGITNLSQVIVSQNQAVLDGMQQQTDMIINIGDDVDMSITNLNDLNAVQDKSDEITNQIYQKIDEGEVEQVLTQRVSDIQDENINDAGFGFVGSLMQRIFDMGFGQVILVSLTLAMAMFVIGRKMG